MMLKKLKRNDIFAYDFRGTWSINMEIRSCNHRSCINWIIRRGGTPPLVAISTPEHDIAQRFSLTAAIFGARAGLALLAPFEGKKKGRPFRDALV